MGSRSKVRLEEPVPLVGLRSLLLFEGVVDVIQKMFGRAHVDGRLRGPLPRIYVDLSLGGLRAW